MSVAVLAPYLPEERWFRFNPRGIHGAPHTARVLVWADSLARKLGKPNALRLEELRWAAAVHDIGRVDDGIDRGHGERSAAWVLARLAIERPATAPLDLGFVAHLCRWHEIPDHDIDRLDLELLILKDADALDRARLGDLDPERLRLAQARRLIGAAERLERVTNRYGDVSAEDVLRAAGRVLDDDRG